MDSAAATTPKRNGIPGVAKRVGDRLQGGVFAMQTVFLIAVIVAMLAEVLFRYVLNNSISYSDDLLILLFTWIIFLGVPRALWSDSAPCIELYSYLPAPWPSLFRGFAWGASATYLVYMASSYVGMASGDLTMQITTLGIPFIWQDIALPIGMCLGFIMLLLRLPLSHEGTPYFLGIPFGIAAGALIFLSPLSPPLTALVSVVGLLLLGVPVAVALGLGGSAMIIAGALGSSSTPAQQALGGATNIVLLAIPLFMVMGALIAQTNLTRRLSALVQAALGWLPGGIGVVDVVTSALFANMSGSAIADTAALGTVFIPQLVQSGEYAPAEAAALQSAAGVIGTVFPPAIALILFATVANLSVIAVFEAAIVPGILIVITMALINVSFARRKGLGGKTPFVLANLGRALPAALPILVIPVILDGGIMSGIFAPAESGAVAVFVVVVMMLLMREISLRQTMRVLRQALDNTGMTMFILVNAVVLGWGFLTSGVAASVQTLLGSLVHSPLALLIVVDLAFLLIHVFIETAPSILIMVPLVMPAVFAAGVNPLQLGAIIVVNSTIGLMLPPVGVSLYVASNLAEVRVSEAIRPVLPFVIGSLIVLALVTLWPTLSLFIPGAH